MNIGILGAGSWGTALASVLLDNQHKVTLWHYRKTFPQNANQLLFTSSLDNLSDKDVILIALPSYSIKNILNSFKINSKTLIVNCSKGFDLETEKTLSSMIIKELNIKSDQLVVLSGPSHAEEVSNKIPTAVVAASSSIENAQIIQKEFSNNYFRIYTTDDLAGVEIGAACKNIISIAAGICIGLNYGDNTIAALISRGLQEIIRFAQKYNANEATFYGLSGLGDLTVTAFSKFSRNREFGINLGKGLSFENAKKEVKMTVEGISATKIVYKLSKKDKINMPIVNQVYSILFDNKNPKIAINELMKRKLIVEKNK